jgi:hypothetical protein
VDRKCLGKLRKSFAGHPDAILFCEFRGKEFFSTHAYLQQFRPGNCVSVLCALGLGCLSVAMSKDAFFQPLKDFLSKVPAIMGTISSGFSSNDLWWAKFTIDTEHPLAWNVVQELGHVVNYVSLEERLPTVFMPVSPPPYMNGGPRDFLSRVIECKDEGFKPETCAEWLEGRLPRPAISRQGVLSVNVFTTAVRPFPS